IPLIVGREFWRGNLESHIVRPGAQFIPRHAAAHDQYRRRRDGDAPGCVRHPPNRIAQPQTRPRQPFRRVPANVSKNFARQSKKRGENRGEGDRRTSEFHLQSIILANSCRPTTVMAPRLLLTFQSGFKEALMNKIVGIVLIVLGVIGLGWGGFTYTTKEK